MISHVPFNGGDHVYPDHCGVSGTRGSAISSVIGPFWIFLLFRMTYNEIASPYLENDHLDVFAREENESGVDGGAGLIVLCCRRVAEMTSWCCSTTGSQ